MLTSGVALSETMDDLVKRGGLWYKKFTDVLFTGEISGKESGKIKDGRKDVKVFLFKLKKQEFHYETDYEPL
jgi:hypothetical protein